MKQYRRILSAALVLLAPPALAGADTVQQPAEIVSTANDQSAISLTIYNNNLALIKDRRKIVLPAGQSQLALREVSARMWPETVLLSGGPEVIEQNFEYDLLSPESLLEKYVGREVGVIRSNPANGTDLPQQQAKVLSAEGGAVLQMDGHIEAGIPGRLVYPDLPANLRDRPTLTMLVQNEAQGPREMELSYLSQGLSWQADYVAELSADEKRLDLSGWVTLTNESGASYRNARLQLVAGQVHQVPRRELVQADAENAPMPLAAAKPAMAEESMFEYHLYSLDRPTTVLERQKKQVALLQAAGVQASKELILRGSEHYYKSERGGLDEKVDVAVELEIKNEKAGGLGLPIPAGTVRVYKKDSKGFLQFVGEDSIDHTPEKAAMRLHLGTAFDVSASRTQTSFRKLGDSTKRNNAYESAYELKLKNAKDRPVQVKVQESIPGDWKMSAESAKSTKVSAHVAQWLVDVPAGGESVLRYTVRVQM